MTIVWREAVCDGFGLFIALAGGSTSGKTYTGLRLARGIVGPTGRIAVLDTEGGRTSHYAPEFHFFEHRMKEPFAPPRFLEAAKSAEENGFGCLLIDNFSLEWMGPGGVLDQHEQYLTRKYGQDMKKREAGSQAAWAKVKPPHKAMMTGFLQLRIPIIFVLRAEKKTKPDAAGVPQDLGWMPLQDARFLYEWTVSFTLHPDTPGKPRYDLPHKIEGQHRKFFPADQLIGEKAGGALWGWANSGASAAPTQSAPPASVGPQPAAPAPVGRIPAVQDRSEAPPPVSPPPPLVSESTSPAPDSHTTPPDDTFPGDLPSRLESPPPPPRQPPANQAEVKAQEFADELLIEVRKLGSREDINTLLNQLAVRSKVTRLAEGHPALHRELLAGINARVSEVALPGGS